MRRATQRSFRFMGAMVATALIAPAAVAEVRLPALFSDHMVLQADTAAPVWGWAEPGEEVTVAIGVQSHAVVADASGKWLARLERLPAGGPHRMTITGASAKPLVIDDVLVGEVWLGSGQSNMGMSVSRAKDFESEQSAADLPRLRYFDVAYRSADTPQEECEGRWVLCSPETVGRFSATLYFFGRELARDLNVPIGLIESSVGGTAIELWIDPGRQQSAPELAGYMAARDKALASFDRAAEQARYESETLPRWRARVKKAKAAGEAPPRKPSSAADVFDRKNGLGGLYNGMIAPLVPYAIRGAVWYQGEANTTREKAEYYQFQLPLLVRSWREVWRQGDFPFAWVQLPNLDNPERDWPTVREAMLKTTSLPNTGMAVTIDVGDPKNIHPTNKQPVGRRLAQWALATVYARDVAASGPIAEAAKFERGEAIVTFRHADDGLAAKNGELRTFELAGDDGQWHAATAAIVGDTIVVSAPEVEKPAAVRYGWSNNPECDLYNGADLPASPFRLYAQ